MVSHCPCYTGVNGESRTFNYGFVDCSGLSSDPKAMAVTLHTKGFILIEILWQITELPVTKMDNARKLYFAILRSVQHHPRRYFDFNSILRGNTLLFSDLLKVLEEMCSEKD